MKRMLILFFFVVACSLSAESQPLWHGRSKERSLGLGVMRPKFSDRNSSASGFIVSVSATFPLRQDMTFLVDVPFVAGSIDGLYYAENEEAMGNPYLGIQFGSGESVFFGDLGLRLPLMDKEKALAAGIGLLADIEHYEAYFPNLFTISAGGNVETEMSPGCWLLGRVGPSAEFPTEGGGDAELAALYAAALQFRYQGYALGCGYSARTILSESSIDDRTVDHFTVGGSYRIDRFEMRLSARFPIDEYLRRGLDAVYGLDLRLIL